MMAWARSGGIAAQGASRSRAIRFFIDKQNQIITPVVRHHGAATVDQFTSRVPYRFNITVSEENGSSCSISLRVQQTNEWNNPLVSLISTP